MRRRTAWIIVAAVVAVITVTTVVVWTNGRSYDDTVAACKKAVDGTSTKTNRPAACDGVSDDDYGAMLVGWALTHPTAN